MLNPKRLIKMARRRRISSMKADACASSDACTTSVADKGHFIVYTTEGKRFMVPLAYLNSNIFKELLKMSEDEFGLGGDGPITFPCDAAFMEYVMSLLRSRVSKDVESALFSSMFTHHCSSSWLLRVGCSQQLVVSSF